MRKSSLERVLASYPEEPGDRRYIVDSGASFHLVASDSLTHKEKVTRKKTAAPIPIITANGEIEVDAMVRVYVKELVIFVWAYVLDCDFAVLSRGMLCDEEGFTYSWIPGRPPTLENRGLRLPASQVITFPAFKQDDEGDTTDVEMPRLAD